MDDTTWIARSKEDMDSILEEARAFYEANDSQVNGSKSILITINNPSPIPATVNIGTKKEQVIELSRKEHARFLGIWLGNKKPAHDTVNRIRQEIRMIVTAIQKKRITDKQAAYIINKVLIPRIEYRTQHIHIPGNMQLAYSPIPENI
jgi:hypothetical protein